MGSRLSLFNALAGDFGSRLLSLDV
jgi:hypothetical protein